MDKQQHILVAPLDWGIGHATRCIPIIQELLKLQCKVSIASSGPALVLLKNEFPQLSFFTLPSYQVHYSRTVPLAMSLACQLPKFLKAIHDEHQELNRIVSNDQVDGVISDNRYGCWSRQVKTAFITHQLSIRMPFGFAWIGWLINYFNRRQIEKFNECWVPDDPQKNLAGDLARDASIAKKYIGLQSRFTADSISKPSVVKYSLLALISGPEPQRSLMEEQVLNQLKNIKGPAVIVEGLPAEKQTIVSDHGIEIFNHLPSEKLKELILKSEVIICRSGYSTLMDLAALGKEKIILIPTPGQTEQEYLAARLADLKLTVVQSQKNIDLKAALQQVDSKEGFASWGTKSNLLPQTLEEWLKR